MSKVIKCRIRIEAPEIEEYFNRIINDDKTMLEVQNKFAQFCNEFVPMQEGVLSQSITVTPQYVQYNAPYAHYMYVGEVYGPNIPIKDSDGNIEGWFSPPGQKKHPTGRQMQFNTEKHPRASKEWDKAMMDSERGDEFWEAVKEILVRRAKELYG